MRTFVFFIMLFLSYSLYATVKPWDETVFVYIKNTYGDQAEKRMRAIQKLILNNQDKSDMEKLVLANNTFNLLPWISDENHWKKSDYWASPLEIITSFGGDCEDISIAKWLFLRHLGVSKEQLYLAYVKIKKQNQAHMVLVYQADPKVPINQSKVYILDNMIGEVRLAKDRPDLKGVYLLQPVSGTVMLLKHNGENVEITETGKLRNLKTFNDLRERFVQERELMKDINGHEYLLPDL